MGQDQRAHAVSHRRFSGLWDRGVVIKHIGEPGEPDHLDQVAPHDGLHEDIGVPAELVEAGAGNRVAGDHDRVVCVIDSVAHGRPDR
jgi:hypothetical protein